MHQGDRRKGQDRRIEDLPVVFDRRISERRSNDPSRRTLMDRRVQTVPVENDRRQGSRRSAEQEAAKEGKEVVPDWMESVLEEASQRQKENPAMAPPPVDEKENAYFEKSSEQRHKEQQRMDIIIMLFVILCFVGLIVLIAFGV